MLRTSLTPKELGIELRHFADKSTEKRKRGQPQPPPQPALPARGDLDATFAISESEARRGTNRPILLPDERQMSVVVPVGAYEERVISLLKELGFPAFPRGHRGTLTLTLTLTPVEETTRESLLKSDSLMSSPSLSERRAAPVLFDLIPHRLEDPANNPLAASVDIADKQARRFYAAINGRRTVRELCTLTSLEKKEVSGVVQRLLAHHRIQLSEPGGQLVESSLLFGDP
jgi:hypothetical protein